MHMPKTAVYALAAAVAAAAVTLPIVVARDDDSDRLDDLLRVVKRARIIDLSHTWDKNSPIADVNPEYSFALDATRTRTRAACSATAGSCRSPRRSCISAASTARRTSTRSGTSGATASSSAASTRRSRPRIPTASARAGSARNSRSTSFPKDLLINRGVLLDVASMINGNLEPLPAGFEITAKHLAQAAHRQRVKLRKGDIVFIRTGWGPYFKSDPALYKGAVLARPGARRGRVPDQARRARRRQRHADLREAPAARLPPQVPKFQVFPVHMRLIADKGIYIIENLNLEGLAKARAYEFAVVIPPLKILGGTGSALRAFALVARDD